MLSKEEKKAINNMKIFARVHQDMTVVTAKEMDIVLKLVEKLQKEADNYIPKEKIREKIEEYKHKDFIKMQVVMKHDKEALKIVEVLEELLEEQN